MKSMFMTGLKCCHRPRKITSAFSTFENGAKIMREFGKYNIGLTRMIDPLLATNAIRLSHSNIDMDVAFEQHQLLVKAMQSVGLQIFELPSDGLADSVFIEDTLVIADLTAMVTHPGAISRRAETERVKTFLESTFGSTLKIICQTEGTLDGGDVLFTGVRFH
jgi:dimethylargininase